MVKTLWKDDSELARQIKLAVGTRANPVAPKDWNIPLMRELITRIRAYPRGTFLREIPMTGIHVFADDFEKIVAKRA